MDKKDGNVLIRKKEYEELLERSRKLSCLEATGVDNWEGYSIAMEEFYGEDNE
jgi:hypothetical protein